MGERRPWVVLAATGLAAAVLGACADDEGGGGGSCAEGSELTVVFTAVGEFEETGVIVGLDGGGRRHRLTDDVGAYSPDLSPDADQIAYAGTGPDGAVGDSGPDNLSVFVVGADGRDRRRLTDGDADEGPDWSPDGRRIVFSRQAEGLPDRPGHRLFTVDADGGVPEPHRATGTADDPRRGPRVGADARGGLIGP